MYNCIVFIALINYQTLPNTTSVHSCGHQKFRVKWKKIGQAEMIQDLKLDSPQIPIEVEENRILRNAHSSFIIINDEYVHVCLYRKRKNSRNSNL